jgi:ribosomal protein S18 acetylase RimI-like enzyme
MRHGIAIRPGTMGDAPALAGIHHAARAVALPGLHEPWTQAEVAGWIGTMLLARHRVLVAADAAGPVGYLGTSAEGEVLHLHVAPAMHRQGIGTALIERAKAAAPGGLTLTCFQRNAAALAFYRRQGFHIVACRDASANEEAEPDVQCAWTPPDQKQTPRGANA